MILNLNKNECKKGKLVIIMKCLNPNNKSEWIDLYSNKNGLQQNI